MKLLLIGFDGLDYRMFSHMAPSWFGELRQKSNYGIAKPEANSAIAGPSWSSILTGLKVETHGITDLYGREDWGGNGSKSFSTVGKPYIWDYLNDAGLACGVMNFPATWPAPEIKGWFVSGWWAELSYTPKILAHLLHEYVVDYLDVVFEKTKPESKLNERGGIAEWIATEDTLEETFERLMEVANSKLHTLIGLPPVDCLLVQFPILDRLGHKTMGIGDRAYCLEQIGKMTLQAEWITKILVERYRPEFLALVSDHGWLLDLEAQWASNTHSENGTWLIKSPTVAGGERIDIANYDFLPSLLKAMGLPIPGEMDGQPKVILKKDEETIAKRLEGWGYVGDLPKDDPILPGAKKAWADSSWCREFTELEDRSADIERIRKILDGIEFKTILDLGCGPGIICEALEWEQYWAVDQSEAMLGLLKERIGDRDNVHVRQGRIEDYQQEDSVDLVICYAVFQHAADAKALFDCVSTFDAKYFLVNFLEWPGEWRLDLPLPHEHDACSKVLPSQEVDAILQDVEVIRRMDIQSEQTNYNYRILLLRGNQHERGLGLNYESLHTAELQTE